MSTSAALALLILVSAWVTTCGYEECGFIQPLVVGGAPLKCIVPWMVSLRGRANNDHDCGGTLITPTVVLTAAHCILDGAPVTVDIGRVERVGEDGSGFETRRVVRAIIHENYNQDYRFNNDVSLLILDQPSLKKVAPLAPRDYCFETLRGCEVRLLGWGTTYLGSPLPFLLQTAIARSVPRRVCEENYRKIFGRDMISRQMICASAPRIDTCNGDSGGPMLLKGSVVGVVSFGYDCATPDAPGVYASVPELRSWIEEKLGGL